MGWIEEWRHQHTRDLSRTSARSVQTGEEQGRQDGLVGELAGAVEVFRLVQGVASAAVRPQDSYNA